MGLFVLLIWGLVLPFLGYMAGRDHNPRARRAMTVALIIVMVFTVLIFKTMCTGDAVTVTPNFPKERTDHNYKTGIEMILMNWAVPACAYVLGVFFRKCGSAIPLSDIRG